MNNTVASYDKHKCLAVTSHCTLLVLINFCPVYSVIHNSIAPSKELCSKMALGEVGVSLP